MLPPGLGSSCRSLSVYCVIAGFQKPSHHPHRMSLCPSGLGVCSVCAYLSRQRKTTNGHSQQPLLDKPLLAFGPAGSPSVDGVLQESFASAATCCGCCWGSSQGLPVRNLYQQQPKLLQCAIAAACPLRAATTTRTTLIEGAKLLAAYVCVYTFVCVCFCQQGGAAVPAWACANSSRACVDLHSIG